MVIPAKFPCLFQNKSSSIQAGKKRFKEHFLHFGFVFSEANIETLYEKKIDAYVC